MASSQDIYITIQDFWDYLTMGTELVGDRLSRGTNKLGTNFGGLNVRGPYVFGTKCVTAGNRRCLFTKIGTQFIV